ncbi:hypothetical protein CCHL11_04560 [Colletotrichum chlorophyti]|uniref:WW domain-containing protein n=1 Tax=Colletotrichum chlorophyti TaxID=708187 RepID=A0A1Q8RRL2_9PEZI|nr:hypothetical protein CCHL11_04560 [Colletotrichum chlorophyti]
MSGLPPGWEWDYDGTRWFYRYKPNGHVQFHFPKEGDEFPDFIDAFSPVPELAPEEKLESQQQLKRRTTHDPDPKSKMHATGGPLKDFGSGPRTGFGGPLADVDDGADDFFFQPENFMYLGPGAYTDVSPEPDEDEQEMSPSKMEGKGNIGATSTGTTKDKALLDATSELSGVSPLQSEANTPSVANSVPVKEEVVGPKPPAKEPAAEPGLVINTHELPGPAHTVSHSPGVPLLDSIERPRPETTPSFNPPPWDPVGIMAEMATEHTAPAHIETHPDPVEMADNAILAPIETRMTELGIAELPERNSPSDRRPTDTSTHQLLHQTAMTDEALYGATFGTGSRPQTSPPPASQSPPKADPPAATAKSTEHPLSQPVQLPAKHVQVTSQTSSNALFTTERQPANTEARQSKYQPYVPGKTISQGSEQPNNDSNLSRREHRNSLTREASLMMGTRSKFETTNIPSVLQPPQIPPKHPVHSDQPPSHQPLNLERPPGPQAAVKGSNTARNLTYSPNPTAQQGSLQHIPQRGGNRKAKVHNHPLQDLT